MSARQDVVFLFDVDNTLLDNDAVVRERYWAISEELRRELGSDVDP